MGVRPKQNDQWIDLHVLEFQKEFRLEWFPNREQPDWIDKHILPYRLRLD